MALLAVAQAAAVQDFVHSLATNLLEQGAYIRIIREMLGHSQRKTTKVDTLLNRDP